MRKKIESKNKLFINYTIMSVVDNTSTLNRRLTAQGDEVSDNKLSKQKSLFTKCKDWVRSYNIFMIVIFCITFIYTTSSVPIGILYISDYIHIINLCTISHLWYYILASLIYALFKSIYLLCIKCENKIKIGLWCILFYFVIEILLFVWGFIEVYVFPNISNTTTTDYINITNVNITACNDLKYTDVWNVGLISVLL